MSARRRSISNRVAQIAASKHSATYSGPQSPNRVIRVLEALAKFPDGLSLTKLGELLDIPKTSLLSLLRVLEMTGYVANSNGTYMLGPLSFRLGLIIVSSFKLTSTLHPLLVKLAAQSQETAMLGMLDETRGEACYIDIAQPDVPVRFFAQVGTYRPLYCTAIGRAILAFQDESFIRRYLSTTKLTKHTASTVTNPRQLTNLLKQIRADGSVATFGEYDATTGAVAAPIFDQAGCARYAVNLAAPVERLNARKEDLMSLVRDAGESFSRVLGYSKQ
jgi:DNA-binding IclR family transcriptional regulator